MKAHWKISALTLLILLVQAFVSAGLDHTKTNFSSSPTLVAEHGTSGPVPFNNRTEIKTVLAMAIAPIVHTNAISEVSLSLCFLYSENIVIQNYQIQILRPPIAHS